MYSVPVRGKLRRPRFIPYSEVDSDSDSGMVPLLADAEGAPPDVDLVEWQKDIKLHIVSGMSASAICDIEAKRFWSGNQIKTEIQESMRIPAIQQMLLVQGQIIDDKRRLHSLVPESIDDVEVLLVRCNPTEKIYWRVTLLQPPMELLDSCGSGCIAVKRPTLHIALLWCDDASMTNDMDEALEKIEGEEIAVSIRAIAADVGYGIGDKIVALANLPEHVPCDGEPVIILDDVPCSMFMKKKIPLYANARATRNIHKEFEPPVVVRGIVEVKRGWQKAPPSMFGTDFFQPSAPPSASNMEKRLERGGYYRETREADLLEGRWVYVKKHSCLGCAMVGFKVHAHRDLLLNAFSRPTDASPTVPEEPPTTDSQPAGVEATQNSSGLGKGKGKGKTKGKACKGSIQNDPGNFGGLGRDNFMATRINRKLKQKVGGLADAEVWRLGQMHFNDQFGELERLAKMAPKMSEQRSFFMYRGIRINLKKHMEKRADGRQVEVPSCLFAGWKKDASIDGQLLLELFDHLCLVC